MNSHHDNNSNLVRVNNKDNNFYYKAIHGARVAAMEGDLDAHKSLFFMARVDISNKNEDGLSPLILASRNGHQHCVDFLLSCNPEAMADLKNDERFQAVKKGDLAKVKILIGQADLTCVNEQGKTLLHFAATECKNKNKFLIVEALLDKVETLTNRKVGEDREQLGHVMIACVKMTVSPSYCNDNMVRLVERLLQLGAPVNTKDSNGNTALFFSVVSAPYYDGGSKSAAYPMIELLIQAGADVNAKNNNGDTALHYAIQNTYHDPAITWNIFTDIRPSQMLIKAGANVNAKNNNGDTISHFAAQYLHKKSFRLIDKILNAGAYANVANHSNQLPLDLMPKQKFYEDQEISASRSLIWNFAALQQLEYRVLALNFLLDNSATNTLHAVPIEVRFKILCYLFKANEPIAGLLKSKPGTIITENSYLEIINTLKLIRARCAVEDYEKVWFIPIPVETNVHERFRTPKSVTFFSEVKKVVADVKKSKDQRVAEIGDHTKNYISSNPDPEDKGMIVLARQKMT
jgi:ankyrin repeat protein